MITDKTELLSAIHDAVAELPRLAEDLEPAKFNAVPYEGSWTPGQLLRHVTKSIGGLAQAMHMPGEPANRDPGERVGELKAVFLDFSHKMKSPDFIVPEERWYEKHDTANDLLAAEEQLKKNVAGADLSGLVTGLPLGPITKLEMLHFTLYHTQRHVHQMKKMLGIYSA